MASKAAWASVAAVSLLVRVAGAAPDVAFPFNSQVPAVARVNEPYLFQFSGSTFSPNTAQYTYSLSNQPSWLTIDGATRTLSGTPGGNDAGAFNFDLTAADSTGAAHMQCILVISSDPAPQLEGDISQQLAATTNLSSSQPPIVTVLPSSPFSFDFGPTSFIDVMQRKLYYYATLTDHTPLPAWLNFDPSSLTFSGTAPDLTAFPQTWSVDLIASDVIGFAGATASFTIAINQEQLVFVPEEQTVNISAGMDVKFEFLKNQIYRNGAKLGPSDLSSALTVSMPSWLNFDATTLDITGTAPSNASDQTFQVIITDEHGNSAASTINLSGGDSSIFEGTIGSLTAYIGQVFTYQVPDSLLRQQDVDLTVTLPASATWLQFDSNSRELQGTVPTQATPSIITATITAKSSNLPGPQTQSFTISIKAVATSLHGTPTGTIPTRTGQPTQFAETHRSHARAGVIAAAVVLTVLFVAALIACLAWCCRRRRRKQEEQTGTPDKRKISGPMFGKDADGAMVAKEMQGDLEKSAGNGNRDSIPRIELDFPTAKRHSKWMRNSRISQASSIGKGEEVLREDSNIPEWGRESVALQTPHDSFSIPTEMARVSRNLSHMSPGKRALNKLRNRREKRDSGGIGLGLGLGLGIMTRGRYALSPKIGSRQKKGISGLRLSAAVSQSSQNSITTRGTSVLSMRGSEYPFPKPPNRSSYTLSRSIPTLSVTDDRRNTIRLVDRSDSIVDTRTLEEKRQSFIRNRASTSYQTPLFSHMSKAESGSGLNVRSSVRGSSIASASERRAWRGKSQLTSFSETSSFDPQARDSRRLSARIRTSFAPNFPRAITKSSLGADDEGCGDNDSEFCTTSSSISSNDLVAEMALPRHQRSWVLPGEASPTPPPASIHSTSRQWTPIEDPNGSKPRPRWKERVEARSSSPLVNVSTTERTSSLAHARLIQTGGKTVLNSPRTMISNNNLSLAKKERPRLVQTKSKRPVSVDEIKRLSSLRAETGTDTDTQPGSEMWEPMQPPVVGATMADTPKSNMSGPVFL